MQAFCLIIFLKKEAKSLNAHSFTHYVRFTSFATNTIQTNNFFSYKKRIKRDNIRLANARLNTI